MGSLFTEESFFGFRGFLVVIIALCGGREIHIPACRYGDIAVRRNIRCLCVYITPGNNDGVAAAGNFRSLLAYGVIDHGFLLRSITVAVCRCFSQQVDISPGQQTDIILRSQPGRMGINILTRFQQQIVTR